MTLTFFLLPCCQIFKRKQECTLTTALTGHERTNPVRNLSVWLFTGLSCAQKTSLWYPVCMPFPTTRRRMEVSGFYDYPDGPQYKIFTSVGPQGCQSKLSWSLHYFTETEKKEETQTKQTVKEGWHFLRAFQKISESRWWRKEISLQKIKNNVNTNKPKP